MKYGFNLPNRGPLAKPEALTTIAGRAEELGFDSILIGDHVVMPRKIDSRYPYSPSGEFPAPAPGECLEQLTMLAFLAGLTQRIRLVTSVIIVPHRNPLVAAKALASIDVLSKGRLVVGIGAGWMREEFEALGLPPFEERGAVTDEYVRAFKELWTSDDPSFEGKYCRFSNVDFLPKPVQKPHPPIWVGGESPRALRRTAELADGWYPIASNPEFPMEEPEQLRTGIDRMSTYARRLGRDPAEIAVIYRPAAYELNRNGAGSSDGQRRPFTGSGQEIASDIRKYEELGVGLLVVDFIRTSPSLEEALRNMEDMTTQIWPHV